MMKTDICRGDLIDNSAKIGSLRMTASYSNMVTSKHFLQTFDTQTMWRLFHVCPEIWMKKTSFFGHLFPRWRRRALGGSFVSEISEMSPQNYLFSGAIV